MKLAIMQPYLFPYIGYFQLINWSDTFVLYNNAQFIKGGWINRNNLLVNNSKHLFCFSIEKKSTYSKINEFSFDKKKIELEKRKFLRTLNISYSKAPNYPEVYNLIENILNSFNENLSQSILISLKQICFYLDIQTNFIGSENLPFNPSDNAQKKVLDMCIALKAEEYANPIGGIDLYNRDFFSQSKINLKFLRTKNIEYKQFNNEFVPWLSIIDVLMFNTKEQIKQKLTQYELI